MFGKRNAAAGLTGAAAIALGAIARWCHLSLGADEGAAFAVIFVTAGLGLSKLLIDRLNKTK